MIDEKRAHASMGHREEPRELREGTAADAAHSVMTMSGWIVMSAYLGEWRGDSSGGPLMQMSGIEMMVSDGHGSVKLLSQRN